MMHGLTVMSKPLALPEVADLQFFKIRTDKIHRRYKSPCFNQENIQKTANIFCKNRSLSRAVLSWTED
jgi:hypothetical protein